MLLAAQWRRDVLDIFLRAQERMLDMAARIAYKALSGNVTDWETLDE